MSSITSSRSSINSDTSSHVSSQFDPVSKDPHFLYEPHLGEAGGWSSSLSERKLAEKFNLSDRSWTVSTKQSCFFSLTPLFTKLFGSSDHLPGKPHFGRIGQASISAQISASSAMGLTGAAVGIFSLGLSFFTGTTSRIKTIFKKFTRFARAWRDGNRLIAEGTPLSTYKGYLLKQQSKRYFKQGIEDVAALAAGLTLQIASAIKIGTTIAIHISKNTAPIAGPVGTVAGIVVAPISIGLSCLGITRNLINLRVSGNPIQLIFETLGRFKRTERLGKFHWVKNSMSQLSVLRREMRRLKVKYGDTPQTEWSIEDKTRLQFLKFAKRELTDKMIRNTIDLGVNVAAIAAATLALISIFSGHAAPVLAGIALGIALGAAGVAISTRIVIVVVRKIQELVIRRRAAQGKGLEYVSSKRMKHYMFARFAEDERKNIHYDFSKPEKDWTLNELAIFTLMKGKVGHLHQDLSRLSGRRYTPYSKHLTPEKFRTNMGINNVYNRLWRRNFL